MEKLRYLVNKEAKNCEECAFLKNEGSIPVRCTRLEQPIYQIDYCITGPMIQLKKKTDFKGLVFPV